MLIRDRGANSLKRGDVTNEASGGRSTRYGSVFGRIVLRPTGLFARHRENLSRIDAIIHSLHDPSSMTALTALEHMVIMLEDRRFLKHAGVDLRSVIREISRVLTFRRFGGASTIEMQFVRTVTGFRQHTFRRKLYEAGLAIIIRSRYGKLAILRSYMACAFFGSGLIGADAAARKLFGKDAAQLTLSEAAFVAAMLARPRPLHGPASWEAKVRLRAAYGLELDRSNQQGNNVPLIDPARAPEPAKAKSPVTQLNKSWT